MPKRKRTLTSPEVYAATGITEGTLPYWARVLKIRKIGQRVIRGRTTNIWPSLFVDRINAARAVSEEVANTD
jgi:hypothetical protein